MKVFLADRQKFTSTYVESCDNIVNLDHINFLDYFLYNFCYRFKFI